MEHLYAIADGEVMTPAGNRAPAGGRPAPARTVSVTSSRRTTPHLTTKEDTRVGILVNGGKSTSSVSGITSTFVGLDSGHPLGLTLENVSLDATAFKASYADIGLYDSDITPSGTGVTTGSVSGSGSVPSCTFPSLPSL